MKAKIPIVCAAILLLATPTAQATLDLDIYEDTVIQSGDDFDIVRIYGDATVGMTGGSVEDLYIENSGTLNLFDGLVGSLYVLDAATLLMYGGELTDALRLADSGVAKLFGGKIAPEISIFGSAVAVFHGYEFELEPNEHLSGCLLDKGSFRSFFRPYISLETNVVLIPEPSTCLMLAAGSLLVRRLSQQHHAA